MKLKRIQTKKIKLIIRKYKYINILFKNLKKTRIMSKRK